MKVVGFSTYLVSLCILGISWCSILQVWSLSAMGD